MKHETDPPEPSAPEEERPTFQAVYDAEARWVWSTLRRLGVPEHCRADAMQEVFVVVHEKLPEYEPRHRLRGWLGAIVARVALTYWRKEGRHLARAVDDEAADARVEPMHHLEHEIADKDELQRTLDDLHPDERFLLLSHHRDGVSVGEIAEHLGEEVGTIKKRLWLARRAFKAAWRRLHARDRSGGGNVLPILGPLTLIEADREPPPLPAGVHEQVWRGIQEALRRGGDEGPGGPVPAARPPVAPRTVAIRVRTLAAIAAACGFAPGVLAGAIWAPFHRAPPPPLAPTVRPEVVLTIPAPPAPTAESAAPAEPPASARVAAHRHAARAGDEASEAEDLMMDRARAALEAGRTSVALAVLEEHAGRFHGGGKRAQQRDSLRIDALLRAGRTGEARARLAAFARAYPNSPRVSALRAVLASP